MDIELLVVGLSHRTAAVEVRERLAGTPEEAASELGALAGLPGKKRNAKRVAQAARKGRCADKEKPLTIREDRIII